MEIYLIRHTTPKVDKNVCYGQSDIDVHTSFYQEACKIKALLPAGIQKVYSSPLIRCKKLAINLFPNHKIEYINDLKEISCGYWELKNWNEIDPIKLNKWMTDFVNVPYPGGENYLQLNKRVIDFFKNVCNTAHPSIAVITHAGVIRSILSFISNTDLKTSFAEFILPYGSISVVNHNQNQFNYKTI